MTYMGETPAFISQAIRVLKYLEGSETLNRVMLECERGELLKLIPENQDRLAKVEYELRYEV